MSAVGSTETYNARAAGAPEFIAFAAFDAGLLDLEPQPGGALQIRWRGGECADVRVRAVAEVPRSHAAALSESQGKP